MDILRENHTIICNKSRNMLLKDLIVITSILLVMDFWSYLPFLRGELGPLDYILHTTLLVIYLLVIISKYKILNRTTVGVDKIVLWTIITVFIGIIPSYIEYNQNVFESFRACLRLVHGLFLYFVLRCWAYDSKRLMSILTFISLVWVFLEIGQQFTYPDFMFSGRFFVYDKLDMRMGLYRFYIWGVDFVMIAFAYWMCKFFSKSKSVINKITYVFPIAIILMSGLICYVSRKHIYAVLVLCVFFAIKSNKQLRIGNVIMVGIIFLFLFMTFFDSFMDMDAYAWEQQGTGDDFIRWLSAKFFIFNFSNSPLYPLWGAGLEVSSSKLGLLLNKISQNGFYQQDCGIIGYYSKFGLLGVSAIVWYIVFFIKKRSKIDIWLHGFFIMKLLLIVFDFWAIWDVGMSAYAVFLYFLHCNFKKNMIMSRKR